VPVYGATNVISKDPADLKKTSLVEGTTPTAGSSVGAKGPRATTWAHGGGGWLGEGGGDGDGGEVKRGGEGGGGEGLGGGGEAGGGDARTVIVGGSTLSSATFSARDRAVMLLARSCTELMTPKAFSTNVIVAVILTLAAVTLRVTAAGSTSIEAARLDIKLPASKVSTVPATVIIRTTLVWDAPPGVICFFSSEQRSGFSGAPSHGGSEGDRGGGGGGCTQT